MILLRFFKSAPAMIRLATTDDIKAIENTYTELLTFEQEHTSNSNWKLGIYPTIKVPKEKVPTKTMFVLEDNHEICASMVLNQDQALEYESIPWKYEATKDKVLVIHTLCIPPSKAGNGYGRAMVEFAKDYALKHGCKVIRLDTYAHNEPAKRLYQKLGFIISGYGTILLQGLIKEDQVYLECKLG